MSSKDTKQVLLNTLYAPYSNFKNSPLYIEGPCQRIIFGEGNPNAAILFIGEAPGEQEDREGRPFVGRSGPLLTRTLQQVGIKREDVYITNIVKCRPPHNRTPFPDELKKGRSLLLEQIKIISPKVICTLGAAALTGLTEKPYSITKTRGQPIDFDGYTLLPTFHPAYILRNQSAYPTFLEDIKKVVKLGRV